MAGNYNDLQIYMEALKLFGDVHRLSTELPELEKYESGSQIRRAADSIATNIVEGYGRRRHKVEFIRFLTFSHASALELISHLEKISLVYPRHEPNCSSLLARTDALCRMIFKFRRYVEKYWNTWDHP